MTMGYPRTEVAGTSPTTRAIRGVIRVRCQVPFEVVYPGRRDVRDASGRLWREQYYSGVARMCMARRDGRREGLCSHSCISGAGVRTSLSGGVAPCGALRLLRGVVWRIAFVCYGGMCDLMDSNCDSRGTWLLGVGGFIV